MSIKIKNIRTLITAIIFLYFPSGNLLAQDASKYTEKSMCGLKKQIDTQKMYEAMPESIPSVCLLSVEGLGGLGAEFIETVQIEVKRQMVLTSAFKPISMTKWLDGEFSDSRTQSIFHFINLLRKKRYPVGVKCVLKPKAIRCGNRYLVLLNLYRLNNGGYPLKALRIMESKKELPEAVANCLFDLRKLYDAGNTIDKKKIAIMPFEVICRTLAEQKNGDFDFIKTSFSEQEGVELKDSDDFFSEILAYQAECTGLFNSAPIAGIKEYAKSAESVSSGNADYMVKGRIQLTDRINLIEVKLINCETGKNIGTYRYFTEKSDIETLWKINNYFLKEICGSVFSADKYVLFEKIEAPNRGLYIGGMFAGKNDLDNIPLPKQNLRIKTGSFMKSDEDDNKSLFIYIEKNRTEIFKGRQGEYVWNLLEK